MHSETIKQRTVVVTLADGRQIEVRRMRWKAARDFLQKLAKHIGSLGLSLEGVMDKLPALVSSAGELVDELLAASTDLTRDDIAGLDWLDVPRLVEPALALNLGPELKNSWAGILKSLAALVPEDLAVSATPTTPGASSTPT